MDYFEYLVTQTNDPDLMPYITGGYNYFDYYNDINDGVKIPQIYAGGVSFTISEE